MARQISGRFETPHLAHYHLHIRWLHCHPKLQLRGAKHAKRAPQLTTQWVRWNTDKKNNSELTKKLAPGENNKEYQNFGSTPFTNPMPQDNDEKELPSRATSQQKQESISLPHYSYLTLWLQSLRYRTLQCSPTPKACTDYSVCQCSTTLNLFEIYWNEWRSRSQKQIVPTVWPVSLTTLPVRNPMPIIPGTSTGVSYPDPDPKSVRGGQFPCCTGTR